MKVLSSTPPVAPVIPAPSPTVYTTATLRSSAPEGVYKPNGSDSIIRAVVIGNGSARTAIFVSGPNIEGLYSHYDWVATDEQVVFAIVPGEKK